MKIILVILPVLLTGCIVQQSQLDALIVNMREVKDATEKMVVDNQKNQASLAHEVVALERDLYQDAKRNKNEQLAEALIERKIQGEVIATKAEELAKVTLPDVKDQPNPLAGLFEMLINLLMNNPTTAGAMTLLTGLAAMQFKKIRDVKADRTQLYSKNAKLKNKATKVALLNPETDKDQILKELEEDA